LARNLPLTSEQAPPDGVESWRWLARLTTTNYREFVETTTA
jgi:hypothetical protein